MASQQICSDARLANEWFSERKRHGEWLREDISKLEALVAQQAGDIANSTRTDLMIRLRKQQDELRELMGLPPLPAR